MAKLIDGFDYRTDKPVAKSRQEWIADLNAVLKAGGRRRVENGETFAHARGARLQFECYATLPAPAQAAP